MPAPDDLTFTSYDSAGAAVLMDELRDTYADAFSAVPGEDIREKSNAFRVRATAGGLHGRDGLAHRSTGRDRSTPRLASQGIGRTLHDTFLSRRSEERATLTSNPKAVDTHALYGRWGWQKAGTVPGKPGAYYREYVRFVLPLLLPIAARSSGYY